MVREIITEFARLTGLSPTGKVPPRRYLWTGCFCRLQLLGNWIDGDEALIFVSE